MEKNLLGHPDGMINLDDIEKKERKIKEEKEKSELRKAIMDEIKKEEESRLDEERKNIAKNLGLEFVKQLQEKYPSIYIGGSLGLFLHGMKIPRMFNSGKSDIDLIIPYFQMFENKE